MSGHLLHATPVLSTSIDVVRCIAPEMDPSGVQVSRRGSVNWRRGVASLGVEPGFFDNSGRNPLRMVQASTAIVLRASGLAYEEVHNLQPDICTYIHAEDTFLSARWALPGSRRRNSPIPPHRVCTLFRFVGVRSTPLYEGSFAGGENKQLTYAQATVWGVGKEVPSSLSLPPFFLWVNSVRRVTGRQQVREGHLPSPN